MTERERLAMTIFEQYLDLPPEEQGEFLRLRCGGDAELRREIDLLISSDREANRLSEAVRAEIADVAAGVRVSQSGSSMAMFGAVLNGRYVIESRIGSGGVGVVFRARDQRLHNRQVVVKVLRETKRDDQWLLNKFLQESEALTRLDHPNVVKVLDQGTLADGRPFLVMEFVKGESLEEFLKLGAVRLEPETVVSLVRQICGAVGAVHAAGIIHRDLKTSNLMVKLNPDGTLTAKLIDFGIAKIFEATSGMQTTTPLTVGTLPYMAAELFDGGEASVASDVYALGVIVFELLTGTRPFLARGSSLVAQILEYRNLQERGAGGKLAALRPDLTERLEKALLVALSFRPEDRYRTVREFENAVLSAFQEIEVEAGVNPDDITLGKNETLRISPNVNVERPVAKAGSEGRDRVLPGLLLVVIAVGAILSLTGFPPGFMSGKKTNTVAPPNPSVSPQPVANDAPPFVVTGIPARVTDGKEFRLTVEFKQAGYFYLLSESPKLRPDSLPDYTFLFPGPGDNGGAARFEKANLVIPPTAQPGFFFSGTKGTERIWCVWSPESIPIFETVRTAANGREEGAIRKPDQIQVIQGILSGNRTAATVVRDYRIERP
jgi:serine/threonine-protein kinase